MKTAQALALFDGADFVTPEQIQVTGCAGHRAPARAGTQARFSGLTARGVVEDGIRKLRVPA